MIAADFPDQKFLLVDDTPENLGMLQRYLVALGLASESVTDGEQAIALLRCRRFDVILSDICMPGLDGMELLRFVRKEYPDIDVILMTGYSEKYSFTDVINAGAADFLEKPCNLDIVKAKLFRILRERRLTTELKREIRQREEMTRLLTGKSAALERRDSQLQGYFVTLEETVRQRTRDYHAAQAALEAVFQSIPDAIISVDEAMLVTHGNEQSRRFLEFELGKPFSAGSGSFQSECATILKNTLRSQEGVRDRRLEITEAAADREPRVVLVSTSLIRDNPERKAGALLIVHDITRLADLEEQLVERRRFRRLVGKSPQMEELYEIVRKLAGVDTTILITGESGTGKELLVEALHASGNRAGKPLVRVNCSALPENLLESELFGHVRGAFTGATRDRTGRIQAAQGGIFFLDEIGEIAPRIQLQLLRFLESREYERVGESVTRKADVRIFAATNVDLAARVQEGLFREDLYYRLKVMVIHVPPLRDRPEDIPSLIEHFLSVFNKKFSKNISRLAPEVLDLFMDHSWPGNVRELKHVIEHACLLASGNELQSKHLPRDLRPAKATVASAGQPARVLTREALIAALRQTGGNKAKTARLLKLSRATLYSKLKEFQLSNDSSI